MIKKIITKILSSKITTIILSVLNALILVLSVAHLVNELSYYNYSPREKTESDFEYILNDGYYSNAIKYKYYNEMNDYKPKSASMKEYYSIIDYYEAGIKYKLAEHQNDIENLEKQKEIMDSKKDEVIIYSYIVDDIDKVLENAR